ncbi:AraC family transcriptional regulator [Rossellomorea sp. SC111]|jgi:hypothetical protein|uniref:AraC family transcriptional regulator n=1 Tax=Rossellomorea sp. SC111 TaxID=2968985 RepID=UPI00215B7134|nr:AraC family transcriptional regulator [Rossellomorea sp. SC111]MCR8850456.1 AraC family transcriptional regulator [Rossellomorea sp. SC111]
MSKLEVKENKRLRLKNVIIFEIRNIELDQLEGHVQKFVNYTQVLNVQMFGPLITRMVGSNIQQDGTVKYDYDVMIQAHDYLQYKDKFKVKSEYHCDHCLYVRYAGKPEHLPFAHSKMELFLFENDLDSNGEIYNVFVSNSQEEIIVDIFRPVLQHATL